MSVSSEISVTPMTDQDASQSVIKKDVELPSAREILADLPTTTSSSLTPRTETVQVEAQQEMFRALKNIIEEVRATDAEKNFDLKDLQDSLEEADANSKGGHRDAETLTSVCDTLYRLWACKSEYLVQAAEIIANGSRDRESFHSIY